MTYTEILKHYADKGMSMTLVEALHHITEMYMEQCGISISLRTVIYEAGEYLYDELLKDDGWKEKMDNEIYADASKETADPEINDALSIILSNPKLINFVAALAKAM